MVNRVERQPASAAPTTWSLLRASTRSQSGQRPDAETDNAWTWWRIGVVVALVAVGIIARWLFRDFQSGDYRGSLTHWATYIEHHGHFRAFRHNFSDYNMPYLYAFSLVLMLPVSHLYAVKLLAIICDLIIMFFTYRIVALRYPRTWLPALASAVVFCLPTVMMNSARWGQADPVYTCFLIGAIYFALGRRSWWTFAFFGIALAIKLQAIFAFPVLLVLIVRRRLRWEALVIIPIVYLVADIPALLAGANLHDLLTVYTSQIGEYPDLTLNAANIYQFFGEYNAAWLGTLGTIVAGIVIIAMMVQLIRRPPTDTHERVLLAFIAFLVVAPYLLPHMHERYFYPADVVTVIAAFLLPRRLWPVPILVQIGSALTYVGSMVPALWVTEKENHNFTDPPEWALILGAISMTLAFLWLLREVYRNLDTGAEVRA